MNKGSVVDRVLIVIPANNEQLTIENCLRHLFISRNALPESLQSRVHIVVVCDACTDNTATLTQNLLCPHRDRALVCNFNNVGKSRAFGAQSAWQLFTDNNSSPGSIWFAFSDADSRVPINWLPLHTQHFAGGSHCVLGLVKVDCENQEMNRRFDHDYQKKLCDDGHSHIHGANMGVRGDYYWTAGGFPILVAHEDLALVKALRAAGARVVSDKELVVTTSHRICGRAPEGFAHHLHNLFTVDSDSLLPVTSHCEVY